MIAAKIIAAAALMSVATMASAAEFESNGKTVEVNYRDLDLSSAKGQNALKWRIWRAAWNTCKHGVRSSDIKECQTVAAAHVRSSVELAIAKAGSGARFADMDKEKPVGAGN
ncbi:UrcA family protein [Sphingobium sp. 22B]|uniref:UrcA family protein n=1 Tax=unclassified Sphingobium TaxID=2611147 RepID=UPI000784C3A3|nr:MULTISPECIES: UrcA family protein [unclassified Sphingobium]KXU29414.1 UrcA family protein [Sphingobium sp. AM]KYC29828.1 UrcA family protein [Sphingobium sp. 22B]OAP29559.1 UrcA family protein [Sphingobium sp. 20006FA]